MQTVLLYDTPYSSPCLFHVFLALQMHDFFLGVFFTRHGFVSLRDFFLPEVIFQNCNFSIS